MGNFQLLEVRIIHSQKRFEKLWISCNIGWIEIWSVLPIRYRPFSRETSFFCRFISHFSLNNNWFKSTQNYPEKTNVLELLDKCGALVDCQSTRDTFLYASSCRTTNAYEVLKVIADAVFRPNILDDEVFAGHITRSNQACGFHKFPKNTRMKMTGQMGVTMKNRKREFRF